MASAEKLLHEAEYSFRNICPGSTNEKKYTALAKRYASSLVQKYPLSPEADQAHNILRRLGFGYAITRPKSKPRPRSRQPVSPSPHSEHTAETPHRHSAQQLEAIAQVLTPTRARNVRATNNDGWHNIWQDFLGLSYSKKKILIFVTLFAIAIVAFTPFLLLFFLYYVTQPAKIQIHLRSVVSYFA